MCESFIYQTWGQFYFSFVTVIELDFCRTEPVVNWIQMINELIVEIVYNRLVFLEKIINWPFRRSWIPLLKELGSWGTYLIHFILISHDNIRPLARIYYNLSLSGSLMHQPKNGFIITDYLSATLTSNRLETLEAKARPKSNQRSIFNWQTDFARYLYIMVNCTRWIIKMLSSTLGDRLNGFSAMIYSRLKNNENRTFFCSPVFFQSKF